MALLEYRGYGRSEGSPSEVRFEDQTFEWDLFHTIVLLGPIYIQFITGGALHGRSSCLRLFAH